MPLKHWPSGREEVRKVPIICGVCNEKVSVGGWVHEEKLVFENCPNCGAPIRCEMFAGPEGEEEKAKKSFPIGAEIKWMIEGAVESERSAKFGPLLQVTDLLLNVLNSGVQYYTHPDLTIPYLFGSICHTLVEKVLTMEHVELVMATGAKRINDATGQNAVTVVGNPDNGGKEISTSEETDEDEENEPDDG
jgi:hypothetical protein